MKINKSSLFLTAMLGMFSLAPLQADTLNLYLKVDGGALNQVATSSTGVINYSNTSTPNYSSISINASGTPALAEPGLDLNSLDVTTSNAFTGSSLVIQLTEQGLSTLTSPLPVMEAFATILRSQNTSAAESISFQNYVDSTNSAEASGCGGSCSLIGSYSTSAQGSTAMNMTGTETFTSPFSETEVITINFSASSQSAFGDDNISSAPEPMSMGLLGGGLALLGVARLRRSKKA